MESEEHLRRLWLCPNSQFRVQMQSLASSDVHLLIELCASRRAHFDVITARLEIHGFQFSDRAGVSAVDVYLSVFHAGIELQRASRRCVTVIAVSVWIRSPIRAVPSPPVPGCDDDATRTCVSRKRRQEDRAHYAQHH